MKPLIFLNSHPIQYFAPLYQKLNEAGFPLTVCYCSGNSHKGQLDQGFGTAVKWDIPLLEGYHSIFLKNYSWKPSIQRGFWGLVNPGIIGFLYKQEKSLLVVHGWAYSTNVFAIIFGKLFGHSVCLRSETPLNQERLKNKWVTSLKHLYLRFLFLFIDRFLYIGEQNKLFYSSLGVKESAMNFTPYAVDNKRFRNIYESVSVSAARKQLDLPAEKKIILYSGKFISKKRPLDLLMAFKELKDENSLLVMVGEGSLRSAMETFILQNNLSGKVLLTGFINQSLIPLYYRAADIFVMCSGLGETWGLSVNEAMNFGVPVIVSDTCGCAYDLVAEQANGAIFETGNILQLSTLLGEYLDLSAERRAQIKDFSLQKINDYSFDRIMGSIEQII